MSLYGILVAIGLMIVMIIYVLRKDLKLEDAIEEKKKEIEITKSLAGIYISLHIIDLEKDTFEEYKSNDLLKQLLNKTDKAAMQMHKAMSELVAENWVERVLTFTDLRTVADRLDGQDTLLLDFEAKRYWARALFVVAKRDDKGKATKVIFITRNIDKYMKDVEKLQRLSNVDQLTGIFNRNAYEDNRKSHEGVPMSENFVLVSIDVNGLKVVNDTLGHAAGDELLQGAAKCLSQCLGSYGSVYRMGGDEFLAILFANKKRLARIKDDLEKTVAKWQGRYVSELRIACGYAARADYPEASYDELFEIADNEMYENKKRYYADKGIDRQGQQLAYEAICGSYTKILLVNLTEDSYKIVQMDAKEKAKDLGRDPKISVWLQRFASFGNVHAEDKPIYFEKTALSYLRSFFKENDKNFSLYYRRKINNEFKYVMMEMVPAKEYTDDNQVVYLYVKDIDNHIY